MFTTKDVRKVTKAPWWDSVKNEVARTISVRIKAGELEIKPHGTLLGQVFIDALNENPDARSYVHYLITRKWEEILLDTEGHYSGEVLAVLSHEEGTRWFSEFQKFLAAAWKNSVDPAKPEKDLPKFRALLETDFFKDFLRIWGGYLKLKRPPYLLADMLVGLMLKDIDFTVFYHWMAASAYEEVIAQIDAKIEGETKELFRSPEAAVFCEEMIGVIARRMKADYEERGISVSGPEQLTKD